MALRAIATIGNPILRTIARPLTKAELASPPIQSLVDDLVDTMRDANGAGLAATQIYEPIQLCAIEVNCNPRYPYKPNVPLTIIVNPVVEIIGSATFSNYEGCLSVPDLRGVVDRAAQIRVRYWTRNGDDVDVTVGGLTAGTFQHEIDHLNGKLFVDRVKDTTSLCTWREFQRHHFEPFSRYARSIVDQYGG